MIQYSIALFNSDAKEIRKMLSNSPLLSIWTDSNSHFIRFNGTGSIETDEETVIQLISRANGSCIMTETEHGTRYDFNDGATINRLLGEEAKLYAVVGQNTIHGTVTPEGKLYGTLALDTKIEDGVAIQTEYFFDVMSYDNKTASYRPVPKKITKSEYDTTTQEMRAFEQRRDKDITFYDVQAQMESEREYLRLHRDAKRLLLPFEQEYKSHGPHWFVTVAPLAGDIVYDSGNTHVVTDDSLAMEPCEFTHSQAWQDLQKELDILFEKAEQRELEDELDEAFGVGRFGYC